MYLVLLIGQQCSVLFNGDADSIGLSINRMLIFIWLSGHLRVQQSFGHET